jgi:hypothetical protein
VVGPPAIGAASTGQVRSSEDSGVLIGNQSRS